MEYNIIFDKELTVEERVLYYFLTNAKQAKINLVKYGFYKIEEVTENELYFTTHSNQELMELLGCGKTKLIKIKKSLEEKGLLIQKRTLDGSNKYFTFDKEVK